MKSSGFLRNGSTNASPELSLERFWRALYSDQEGHFIILSGRWDPATEKLVNVHEKPFRWPHAVAQAVKYAAQQDARGYDVFQTVHLLQNEERKTEFASPIRALWADLDEAPLPADDLRPSIIVESSPGRMQAYWPLSKPIEPSHAAELNRRLAEMLGVPPGRDGKPQTCWKLTQVLRVPGTHHRKDRRLIHKVRIAEATARVFDSEQIAAWMSPIPKPQPEERNEKPTGGDWVLDALLGVKQGDGRGREPTGHRLANYFLAKGLRPDHTREILLIWNATRNTPPLSDREVLRTFENALRDWRRQRTETLPGAENSILAFYVSPEGRASTHGERSTYVSLIWAEWKRGLLPPESEPWKTSWLDLSAREIEDCGGVGRRSVGRVLKRMAERRLIAYKPGRPFGKGQKGRAARVRRLPLPSGALLPHNPGVVPKIMAQFFPVTTAGGLRPPRRKASLPLWRWSNLPFAAIGGNFFRPASERHGNPIQRSSDSWERRQP